MITIFCGSARRGRTTATVTVDPVSPKQHRANLGQRHFVRALPFDRFENVRVLNPRLVRRAAGNHRHHGRVSKALRDRRANIGLALGFIAL